MLQKLKAAIFCFWLALFLSQSLFDVFALATLQQPLNHIEVPLVCAVAQCTTIFDRSIWFTKKSSAVLTFADGRQVEVPFMGVIDDVHQNYYRFVTFLKMPMYSDTPALEKFLEVYYCRPADFVQRYLPSPQAKPIQVDWHYRSWDDEIKLERSVKCLN